MYNHPLLYLPQSLGLAGGLVSFMFFLLSSFLFLIFFYQVLSIFYFLKFVLVFSGLLLTRVLLLTKTLM